MMVRPRVEHLLFACSVGLSILMLLWAFVQAGRGFEFSDEGFYLTWISNPFEYDLSLTQFGFIYYPWYVALRGDIAWLRRLNIFFTFGLSAIFMRTLLASLLSKSIDTALTSWILAFAFATSSFALFGFWLAVPNYNSLAFQALLLAGISFLIVLENQGTAKNNLAGALLGVGGWLAFMAKPSTAMALAAVSLVYLIIARRLSWRHGSWAAGLSLACLGLSAFFIDGSLEAFIKRLRFGIQLAGTLGGGHTFGEIFRVDFLNISVREFTILIVETLLVFGACKWAISQKTWKRWAVKTLSLFVVLFAVICVFGSWLQPIDIGPWRVFLIWPVALAAVALSVSNLGLRFFRSLPISHKAVAVLFLLLPHVYAFGTNGNYWEAGGFAGLFWLASGLVVCGGLARQLKSWSFAIILAIATQMVAFVLLQIAIERPYRQDQSLRLNTTSVLVGAENSHLEVSQSIGRFVKEIRHSANEAGFKKGGPLIDLTGQSPGIVFLLGGIAPGQPWLLGGYAGSLDYAKGAFRRASCEVLSLAWILVETEGPFGISAQALSSFGADFPDDYLPMSSWSVPAGVGGLKSPREQRLYRPVQGAKVLEVCRGLRMREKS